MARIAASPNNSLQRTHQSVTFFRFAKTAPLCRAAELWALGDYPVRKLFLSFCLTALPTTVAAQMTTELVAAEIGEILCEDPD